VDGIQGASFLAEIKERLEKSDAFRELGKTEDAAPLNH
jgi:hypothetical protein